MSDKMRWRYGDINPVVAAVGYATVIEIGDLLWHDMIDAKPASCRPDHGSESVNQALFADKFLGVAMQRSRAGETDPIRVATTGVFEFDCPSDTFELGELVGVHVDSTWNVVFTSGPLCNQIVAKVPAAKYAIGRVVKRASTPTNSVLVDIRSTIMTGGVFVRNE